MIADLKLTLLNFVILRPLVIATEASIFLTTYVFLQKNFSIFHLNFKLFPPLEALMVTLFTMLSVDFASYIVHRLLHTQFFWGLHSIHHAAEELTPLTTYRQHPLEPFMLYGARGFFEGVSLFIFYFIFPQQAAIITYFGVGIGFLLYMLTVNLHHSPIPVQYSKTFSKILISPHHHHIHHSSAEHHQNTNFGVIFSFWDQMFGTFCNPVLDLERLKFGLSNQTNEISLSK